MKWPLSNCEPSIPNVGAVGDFAYRRSFYYHPGIDLYCGNGHIVQAIEDGVIIKIEQFTGAEADPPSPWWNNTWSILVEGKSGVIGYCELLPHPMWKLGSVVKEGDPLAIIIPVLKKDKGNGTTMLHLEHYELGTTEHVTWILDTPKPEQLKDPRELLNEIISKSSGSR